MKTFSYNTYEYEFKQALSLINRIIEETKEVKMSDELRAESESLINDNFDKVFPIKRHPQKYDRSTLNGKYISHLDVYPNGRVLVNNGEEEKEFYLDCNGMENSSADSILCDLQDKSGINVSKY